MKLLIIADLHAEFEIFEVPKGLDYDVAVLAGDIVAPGRVAARWLRNPARFGDKPIVQPGNVSSIASAAALSPIPSARVTTAPITRAPELLPRRDDERRRKTR